MSRFRPLAGALVCVLALPVSAGSALIPASASSAPTTSISAVRTTDVSTNKPKPRPGAREKKKPLTAKQRKVRAERAAKRAAKLRQQKLKQQRAAAARAAKIRQIRSYVPAKGMTLNNPLSKQGRWANQAKIVGSIDASKPGSRIRIASWNMNSTRATTALLAAHKRGVSVRLIMASTNAKERPNNRNFLKLKRELAVGNSKRPVTMRSWARYCKGSCRGRGGTAHTKFYLFSHLYRTRDVAMWGSANLTRMAAVGQWNDLYTMRNPRAFAYYNNIFNQMALDSPQRYPLRRAIWGNTVAEIFPDVSVRPQPDPIMAVLNNTRCQNANPAAGTKGRTRIRVAINAQQRQRGADIARKLKKLYNAGCDVKVIYGLLGGYTFQAYKDRSGRGQVPIRQIVQDFNGDGVYDRYLHNKAMTISGWVGKNKNARLTLFGSANWSPLALQSDETFSWIYAAGLEKQYTNWINYWFHNPPKNRVGRNFMGARVDPYAKFDTD